MEKLFIFEYIKDLGFLVKRGYELFDVLASKLLYDKDFCQNRSLDSNSQEEKKFLLCLQDNYKQYELYVRTKYPREEQINKYKNQYKVFEFSEFTPENQKYEQIEFGQKIGCKLGDANIKWIEKWAILTPLSSNDKNLKYISKLWYEDHYLIKGECKRQTLIENKLDNELVDIYSYEAINKEMIEILSYQTYFNADTGSKKFEFGIKQFKSELQTLIYDKWETNFDEQIYQNEKLFKNLISLEQQGERNGRNKFGHLWNEKWNISEDGKQESWQKWSEENQDEVLNKWGESQFTQINEKQTRVKWYEKLQKSIDYWERYSETETHFKSHNFSQTYVVREGKKEFQNNKGLFSQENWQEFNDGQIRVNKILDDGLGTKTTTEYGLQKQGDSLSYEYERSLIDDIKNNQQVFLDKGKIMDNQEWKTERLINFLANYERVNNEGRDSQGQWKEEWFSQGSTKWARKEGQNYQTQDQWREEWYEKKLNGELIEANCEKWGQNLQRNEEWVEKWGEVFNQERNEKWADKWYIDRTSGERKGETWGHQYNERGEAKHHWYEKWNNGETVEKREENY